MEPRSSAATLGVHRQGSGIVVNVAPPKVTVLVPAEPPWIHYGVPLAAFVAAAFAILTFVRLQRQINLALQQIRLANRQIEQQEKALDATLKDLEITSHQAAAADNERARLPDLQAQLVFTARPGERNDAGRTLAFVELRVANYGRAAANNVHVVLRADPQSIVQDLDELAKYRSETPPHADRERYLEFGADSLGMWSATAFDRNLEILPNEDAALLGQGWFYVRPGLIEIQWRIICRQGEYPDGGGETSLRQNLQW